MKSHTITGGGGIRLHIVEAGKPNGRPVLFIHGFSQCGLSWEAQLRSDLADDYRLVAMDLRGHGLSDKPRESYAHTRSWADDIDSAIQSLRLDRPMLCGWSYGPLVILDYIRHFGERDISAIQFVGGVTKLGSAEARSVLTPEFLGLAPGFFSTETEESVRSLEALLRMCFAKEPSAPDLYRMLGYSVSVPPHVRRALLSRSVDNDDLLNNLRKPVFIVHGTEDKVVKVSAVDQHKAAVPHAQIHLIPHSGHAPFADDPAGFNQHLRRCIAATPAM